MAFVHFVAFGVLLVAAQATDEPRIGFGIGHPGTGLGRVIGGMEADRFEFPHLVSLQWASSTFADYDHFCGGTLIDPRWVLTSAQCVLAVPSYGIFVVRGGKHDLKVSENNEQVVRVDATIVHESYKGGIDPYDIALLYISASLIPSAAVEPIKLAKNGAKPTGNAIFAGWGFVLPGIPTNYYKLQKVVLPIIDYVTCKLELERAIGRSDLYSTNICTGTSNGQVSACLGDYGGPLIQENDSGDYELIGVSAWNGIPACVGPMAPSVYVDVAQFVDWIGATIKNFTKTREIV